MSRFPKAGHLAAWAGLAPAIYESAGKRTPVGARHGNKWLNHMLVESACPVGRMHSKNYLAVQHARLMKRRGIGRAQVAAAHSIPVLMPIGEPKGRGPVDIALSEGRSTRY